MNTHNTQEAVVAKPAGSVEKEITNQQLMKKLLELEKKIEVIEKKLTHPLIN